MGKDHIRDYVIAAFRFYARNGMSSEKYKQEIYNQALEEYKRREPRARINNSSEIVVMGSEKSVENNMAAIKDMEAVEWTLAEIRTNSAKYPGMLRVIEIVYFTDANLELHKGDIRSRILKAEIDTHISERNIYRYLKKVRIMFAEKRGLRT